MINDLRPKLLILFMALAGLAAGFYALDATAQRTPYGHGFSTNTSGTNALATASVATATVLAAIPAADPRRTAGTVVRLASGYQYQFHASSTAADASNTVVVTPAAGSGRWLLLPGAVDLALAAVAYTTADTAVSFTVPVGARLRVARMYMVNSVAWSGGSSSAIGFSSSQSPHNTAGDLHGGAAGELTAAAGTGAKEGTVGADLAAGVILEAGATVIFNRIASVYTAGAGVPHIVGDLLLNPGA
jgi:hypothetical protein